MGVTQPVNPRSGQHARERIALYGPPKVGKTHQFLNIAKWHQDQGSDARFFAVSSDLSYEVLLMDEPFDQLENFEYRDVLTFQDWIDTVREFNSTVKQGDWIAGDLMDHAWTACQDEYARAVTSAAGGNLEDMGDLWQTAGPAKYPIEGWQWGMPNARYAILANNLLLRSPAHLMFMYGQKPILDIESNDPMAKKVKAMFKHVGLMPTGKKDDPFRWHTILHLDSNAKHEQVAATAGERWRNRAWLGKKMGNGMVKDEPIDDFFMDYLVKIAGWGIE